MAGARAFREAWVTAEIENAADFESADARRLRYALNWALYENSAYRNVHTWAQGYRTQYGLYKYIRNIYNPAYRLGEFWTTHLLGGLLDPQAGDGSERESAVPIIVTGANETRLRAAIARVWKLSNWQVYKDTFCLWGSVLGDVAIKIIDDAERSRVYMDVINPAHITEAETDHYGNVKAYRLDFAVDDPDRAGQQVKYTEIAERDGDDVVYTTMRNDKAWDWTGAGAEWRVPYGFIPLVLTQHHNVGLAWGWSELHPNLSKIREADDVASAISDHIRKSVNAPWLFTGINAPKTTPTLTGQQATAMQPEPGREEMPALYGPVGADAKALVANLDYEGALQHLAGVVEQIEREYPELRFDNMRVSGDASGKALRIARQPVEAKVVRVRATYDDALRRAQQMAISIGGWQGYPGFEGFTLDSYARGELDHEIGQRPVFPADVMEQNEEEQAFWQAAALAVTGGATLEGYLRDKGWDDARIQDLIYGGVVEQ